FSYAYGQSLRSEFRDDENCELLLYRALGCAIAEDSLRPSESSGDFLRRVDLPVGSRTCCDYDSAKRGLIGNNDERIHNYIADRRGRVASRAGYRAARQTRRRFLDLARQIRAVHRR